jgi:hypothetical protein
MGESIYEFRAVRSRAVSTMLATVIIPELLMKVWSVASDAMGPNIGSGTWERQERVKVACVIKYRKSNALFSYTNCFTL